MRIALGLMSAAVALTLAGCASGPAGEVATRAQSQMVGMPKARLLSCAGVPARQAEASGNEYFTYVQRPSYAGGGPSTSIGVGGGSGGVGVGLGFGLPLFSSGGDSGCEATFTISGGVVQRLTYPAGSHLPSCAAIVENCVPPS